ncbi:hypothetical protein BpHYR1_027590 [Brachionus plicatilis]|uniref:Uncharacterized protein n=1 Tax=Brachionus plicatilis TaxID=10195 RepID=A0A3M7PI29_BRAPC|nr:hypothetical protein BpHYR1_027590 [Brachionus plicatilis]
MHASKLEIQVLVHALASINPMLKLTILSLDAAGALKFSDSFSIELYYDETNETFKIVKQKYRLFKKI